MPTPSTPCGRLAPPAARRTTFSPRNCILSPGEFASFLDPGSSSWEEESDEEYTAGGSDTSDSEFGDLSFCHAPHSDLDDHDTLDDELFDLEDVQEEDEPPHEPPPSSSDPGTVPFWFGLEEAEHVHQVIEQYERELRGRMSEETDPLRQSRSHRPYVASVARAVWKPQRQGAQAQLFQTFDEVQVCNNQRVRPHRPQVTLGAHFLLTTWDGDGLPISFFHPPAASISSLRSETEDAPRQFLYRQPEWVQENHDPDAPARNFDYFASSLYHRVGYAHVPSHDSPFYEPLRRRMERREDLSALQGDGALAQLLQFSPP